MALAYLNQASEAFTRPDTPAATPEQVAAPALPGQPAAGTAPAGAPFYDPAMAARQRDLALELSQGTAGLELQRSRLTEDANLMRPYMERRFRSEMRGQAENVASRGFYGANNGIMASQLGARADEQAYQTGQFENRLARGMEDIDLALQNLNERTTMGGASAALGGAGNATGGVIAGLPF